MILVEMPYQILISFLFTPLIIYYVNFNMTSWEVVIKFFIIVAGSSLTGHAMVILIGCYAENKEEANTFSMMLYMPSTLFCGFIVNQESLNWVVTPFKYLSVHRYSFQALGINDLDGLHLECPTDCNPLPSLGIGNDFWINIVMQ